MTRTGPLNPNGIAVSPRRQMFNRTVNRAVRAAQELSPFGRDSGRRALQSVTFVVPRFGADVFGGIERACLRLATGMASLGVSVKVITTCATDHLTWANETEPGTIVEGGVAVTRLPTDRLRHGELDRLSEAIHPGYVTASLTEQERWFVEQGPHCPGLADELLADTSDLVVAMPYLYWPTLVASQLVGPRLVMHPAAHDEWPFSLPLVGAMLRSARHLIFHSDAERDLVESTHLLRGTPGTVCSLGIDLPGAAPSLVGNDGGLPFARPYLLYVGRVERAKGVYDLVGQVDAVNRQRTAPIRLLVAGQGTFDAPLPPHVEVLGEVPEVEKWRLLRGALALVMPSANESFSFASLEAMAVGTPVLATQRCAAVVDHLRASGAGASYDGQDELAGLVERLVAEPGYRRRLAAAGPSYAAKLSWPAVAEHYRAVTESVWQRRSGRMSR